MGHALSQFSKVVIEKRKMKRNMTVFSTKKREEANWLVTTLFLSGGANIYLAMVKKDREDAVYIRYIEYLQEIDLEQ